MAELDYSSYQDIREEAGQHHLNKLESLAGVKNGTNKIFTSSRTYIVDRNYNDTLDVGSSGDVIVYVNNIAVAVDTIDPNTGQITLIAAPANDATVLATYAHSAISDTKVAKYRKEAISYVQRKINGIIDFGAWTSETIPPIVQTVVRIYAAGLILIRDQGLNADTENTSKDGYKRLSTAKSLLTEYLEEASTDSTSTNKTGVSSKTDGNLFYRNTRLSEYNDSVAKDDHFMRRD